MIKFSGPAFAGVDNRLMSLQLVEQGLTDAAMFTAAGEVVQPSEVLYKKPVLVERGSFRPVTKLTLDLLERRAEQFLAGAGRAGQAPVVLAEMTLRSLRAGESDHARFPRACRHPRRARLRRAHLTVRAVLPAGRYLAPTPTAHRARRRLAERRSRRREVLRGSAAACSRPGPALQAIGQDVRLPAARSRHGTRNDHRDAAREGRVGASPQLPARGGAPPAGPGATTSACSRS